MATVFGWFSNRLFASCPPVTKCSAEAGDQIWTTPVVPVDELVHMQRMVFLTMIVSVVSVLTLLYLLKFRPGLLYQKEDLDRFSQELFQGIYSAIEQLEAVSANRIREQSESPDKVVPELRAEQPVSELSQILQSVRYLEANQEVIADGLSKVLELWKKLDEAEFEPAAGTAPDLLSQTTSDPTTDLHDGDTILNTSDSILVHDMDTSSEFEADSFS